MKCDELKTVCYIDAYSTMPVYCAKEVDEAIAELKDIIKNNQSAYYVDLGIVANDCEKLKAENERLTIDKRNEELRADQADEAIKKLKVENERLKSYIKCVLYRGHITEDAAVATGRELLEEYK